MISAAKRNDCASREPDKQHLFYPQKAGTSTTIASGGAHAANYRIRNDKPVANAKTET